MGAVALWVRSVLRRHRRATVSLALLTGLVAGLVGTTFQAARRAGGALDRHTERSRAYDLDVPACPPGTPDPNDLDFQQVLDLCLNIAIDERFEDTVLSSVPGVEAMSTSGALVAAVLDPTAPNGWGRAGLLYPMATPDPVGYLRHQVLLSGHYLDAAAPDEVMVGEAAARAGHIHAGDTLRLASWHPEHLDQATDGRLPPETDLVTVTVTGVVRTLRDMQRTSEGDVTGSVLPDAIYADHGFFEAYGSSFASYGTVAEVRLTGGPEAADQFVKDLETAAPDWFADPTPTNADIDYPALRRVVSVEQHAVFVFGLIALVAGWGLVGLILGRQVRRELDEVPTLEALGLTTRQVLAGMAARVGVAAAGATIVAVAVIVAMSPLTPLGMARRLEYSHPVRVDLAVIAAVVGALVAFFATTIAVVTVVARARARGRRRAARVRVPFASSASRFGPVPRVGMNFAGGSSPCVVVAVGALAISFAAGAGVLVASFDRVVDEPVRYGAWWDVVVGEYSGPEGLADATARLNADPYVDEAAGIVEEEAGTLADGLPVAFTSLVPVVGAPGPIMVSGRAAATVDEVAVGASTARKLHKHIGDTVTITSSSSDGVAQVATITGIAVLADPVNSAVNAGDGIVVVPELGDQLSAGGAQSIAVRFKPGVDRDAAIASVVADFPASTRLPQPQADIRNLQRLRFVPWLIAMLVAALALGSLVHALVTLLARHGRDLAVLAAMGLTRRQRRRVGVVAALFLTGLSALLGVPFGILLGRWLWRVIARGASIPSGPLTSWTAAGAAASLALAVSVLVAAFAARWVTRRTPAAQLHAE